MKRVWRRATLGVLLITATLALLPWIILNWIMVRPPSYAPARVDAVQLRSWPEHDAIYQATQFPYVLSLETGEGALEYVGALHTSDAAHAQLNEIESRWAEFAPTVAFCEGRARMFRFASRPKSGALSESELVRILAYRNSIPLHTLEPTYETEVSGLLEHFDPELVATYMTLRVFTSEASGVDASARDTLALNLLHKRTNVNGLRGSLSSIGELDAYWQQEFPEAKNWRKLTSTEGIPRLRQVGDQSREVRGRHMVASLTELVNNGERVFAVVGASHVIRQEPELRRQLKR